MADKIYNLRDLKRTTPIGWTNERVAGYFQWGKAVTDGMNGPQVNSKLHGILNEIYREQGL